MIFLVTVGNACIAWVASKVMIYLIHGQSVYFADQSSMFEEPSRLFLEGPVNQPTASSMVEYFYRNIVEVPRDSISTMQWAKDPVIRSSTMLDFIGESFLHSMFSKILRRFLIYIIFIDDHLYVQRTESNRGFRTFADDNESTSLQLRNSCHRCSQNP